MNGMPRRFSLSSLLEQLAGRQVEVAEGGAVDAGHHRDDGRAGRQLGDRAQRVDIALRPRQPLLPAHVTGRQVDRGEQLGLRGEHRDVVAEDDPAEVDEPDADRELPLLVDGAQQLRVGVGQPVEHPAAVEVLRGLLGLGGRRRVGAGSTGGVIVGVPAGASVAAGEQDSRDERSGDERQTSHDPSPESDADVLPTWTSRHAARAGRILSHRPRRRAPPRPRSCRWSRSRCRPGGWPRRRGRRRRSGCAA